MVKKVACLLTVLLLSGCFKSTVHAQDIPYEGYTYDHNKTEQAAPSMYRPDRKYSFGTVEAPAALTDMYAYEGQLYVLDSAGSQVLVLNEGLELSGSIAFMDREGNPVSFPQAQGLFVCQWGIYISDTVGLCVDRFDLDGSFVMRYEKPQSPAYDDAIPFAVSKVVVDKGGNVYALVDGLYAGAVMFAQSGEFLGFFGPNEVEMTVEMLLDQSWKRLLTDEQKQAMNRFVPMAYTSFDIDQENFIYTCSRNAINENTRVRRLNPSGKGLWDGRKLFFGDHIPASQWVDGLPNESQIVDVNIGENGVLSVLDAARGRVFLYDENGTLLGVFGGRGNQLGTVEEAAALESIGNHIYVMDKKSSDITRYTLTEYGEVFYQALDLYNSGEYEKAMPLWQKVLEKNSYCQLAYTGIGKALLKQGDFAEALKSFRLGQDREEYSQAFEEYRFLFMREHFTVIVVVLSAVAAGIFVFGRWRKKHGSKRNKTRHWDMLKAPIATLEDFLYKKEWSVPFATVTVAVWFLLEILKYFGTGFAFNQNNPESFNIFLPLMSTVVLYLLFAIVNWAVSTLSEGKGTLKMIYCSMSYVLLPYLITQTVCLLLSQVFVLEEQAFLVFIALAGLVWSGILLMIVITTVHDYTLGKACGNLLLTLLGIVIVVFLLFMLVVLFEQVANLFLTVYNELTLRM